MKAENTAPEFYPGKHFQSLFNFFHEEHDLILTESQLQDIIHEVNSLSTKEGEEEKDFWCKDYHLTIAEETGEKAIKCKMQCVACKVEMNPFKANF